MHEGIKECSSKHDEKKEKKKREKKYSPYPMKRERDGS
jgi:hypothetical protein